MLGIVHLISVRSWANLNFFHNSAVMPRMPSIFHLGIVHLISVRSWANLNFFHNSAVIPQIPSIFHLLHHRHSILDPVTTFFFSIPQPLGAKTFAFLFNVRFCRQSSQVRPVIAFLYPHVVKIYFHCIVPG